MNWGHYTITSVAYSPGDHWTVEFHLGESISIPKELYPECPHVGDTISIDPPESAYNGTETICCAIGEKLLWDRWEEFPVIVGD